MSAVAAPSNGLIDIHRHSLLATELITKVNTLYPVKLRVQDLFSYPTLSSLCGFIDARMEQSEGNRQIEQPAVPTIDLEAEVEKHDVCVVK